MSSSKLYQLLSLPPSVRTIAAKRTLSHNSLRKISLSWIRKLSTSNDYHVEFQSPDVESQSSANPTEISHFNALASSWWDLHGSSKLLHLMNPLRHNFMQQCLKSDMYNTDKKLRYLDVGCGGGIFAESAARLWSTMSVTAIDPTPEVITVAKRHQRHDPLLLEKGRLDYRNNAIEDLSIPTTPENGYDVVTLFEVVEHIQKPSPFLQSCLKQLNPGGWLIGSTIARTNTSWFTTKVMAEDILRLVPRGTHEWSQYIEPHELRNWSRAQPELDVEGSGWQVMGVVYVPGFGWKEVDGSEAWGNYFFGIRKKGVDA